ncbi:MAG: flippase-like domain-containing protein [Solirubrobacterales bacterium]|nr:flippase-like domain-containing protein [Solirubrobacterales bacterium]
MSTASRRVPRGHGSVWRRYRPAITAVVALLVAAAFAHYVLPHIVSLGPTLRRLRQGHSAWLAVGAALEACSLFGEVALFRGVFARPANRINWSSSAEITFAGAAATKLVAAAGAGGVAVTVWGLRVFGVSGEEAANGMICFGVLTYGVYAAAVAIAGFGLWFGLFSGPAPAGLTLVPATLASLVIVVAFSTLFADRALTEFCERRAERSRGRAAKWWHRAAAVPRSVRAGLLAALGMVRRRDPSLLGAVAYWGFDIGALWASYRAFGHSPPGAVLVMGYYVGTAANVLPLPGGIGGVEAGMIGAFVGFRVKASLAALAVLGYRTISYWLPTLPGAVAYLRLRRTAGSSTPKG